MAERHVSAVLDDDTDSSIPVVESVGWLNITSKSEGNSDQFARKAEDLRDLSGLNSAFKRRVTTKINKFQRGSNGEAESKQILDKDFIDGYDTFEVVEPRYNMEYLAKLYEVSAPHHAAVDAKVSNIVGLGYKFVETSKTKRLLESISSNQKKTKTTRQKLEAHRDELLELIESYNEEDSFTEILIKVWRDYETMGNGYIEVGRKKDGTIGYIGHIPAQTMRVRKKRDGFVQISGFNVRFFAPFGYQDMRSPLGDGKPNEVIHIKKYSPTSSHYGIPDIIAAKGAVAGDEFASRFNLDYFENKAIPRHLITLKGAKLGSAAETALLSFFETGLKGQNHRSLFIPLPPGDKENPVELNIEPIEAGRQDSSFGDYGKSNLMYILMVHRVPITKVSVGDGSSLALARDADKTFKEQVCAPEQRIFEKKISRIIKELTDAFMLKLNEMTLTDEDTQSKIDERDRKAGIKTANEVRVSRGMPTIEGGDELFDLNGKSDAASETRAEQTTNRERDSTRSASATDSAGESRSPKGDGRSSP